MVASEPAADLSLIQLERVPAEAKSSPLANSDPIQVGDPVIIVGAPYGVSYSLSNGLISALPRRQSRRAGRTRAMTVSAEMARES